MKKHLLLAAAVAFGTSLMAQTDQGGWLLSGASDLGFTSGKQDNDQKDATSNFGLDVQGGYFFMDNFAAGLMIGFNSSKTGDVSSSEFGVGPFVRYYAPFKLFGQLSYKFGSSKDDDGTSDFKVKTGDFGIGVGYAAFLNDHVAIEPMLGYDLTSMKVDASGAESVSGGQFGINIGIAVYLGN